MSFEEQLKEKVSEVEDIVLSFLPIEEGYQKTVLSAMNYSVKAGGKRLRPMLMLETYRLFGGQGDVIYSFMAAIEMIHTYSLIHDDLPAMDNDELRRGLPTCHVKFGEAMAILAGDGLLNFAYETAASGVMVAANENIKIAGVGSISKVEDAIKALQVLSTKAGIYGMVGGQVVDVESEKTGTKIDKKQLDFIHVNKTSALIEASMMIGAILAGATEAQVRLVEKVAKYTGLAFQIQDDILDVEGDEAVLGKPIGSDEKNEKATYVSFEGLEKAKEDVKKYTDEATKLLGELDVKNEFLNQLLEYLVYRKN